MPLNQQTIQNIKNAFDSILRADYITLDQITELENLEKYYVDFFGILSGLLQKQDNFISGRRGTGKTTNLLRGYYECLKTISPKLKSQKSVFGTEKILPIYIDLSTCIDLFDSENDLDLVEIHFVRQIIESLKRQLGIMFDEGFLSMFKDNPAIEDLDFIEKVLVEGIALINNKEVTYSQKIKNEESAEISAALSAKPTLGAKIKETNGIEVSKSYVQLRGINVQDFLNKINDIRKKAKINCIYVFVDEYSDLNAESQRKFANLLKTFLGSRINMFFKVGVITDRYDFGDRIIIGRDIFPIPLDFNEYVERYGGAVAALKKMQEFVEMLIQRRLEIFCPTIALDDIFRSNREQVFYRISRETIGVSRTIGMILQNAFTQASLGDQKIGLSEINYGISTARKTYEKQFQGGVRRKLIPGFYMDMWNAILYKAVNEKSKHPDRPASHIMVDPVRKEYLNVLCENFHLHFLSENVSSKYGGKYNLYCIDFDICNEYNIKFAEEKDEFTAARFIYDSVLSQFDAYFTSDVSKSYRCPTCKKIYDEKELGRARIKRCFDDDIILEEIIHLNAPKTEGNFAEVEIKILGLISALEEDEAMSARDIADAVGCTSQKVGNWGTRVLAKKGLIQIKNRDGKNYYYSSDFD